MSKAQRRSNQYSRGIGYILFVAGSSFTVWLSYAIWLGYETHSWQPTTGMIYTSEQVQKAERGSEALYTHHLVYQYQYNGTLLKGTQVYRTDLPFASERISQERLKQFPVGSVQNVYTNPTSPDQSVLIQGISIQLILALVASIACLLVGLLTTKKA